jgi:aryl-alcohol dehydrogenase-like predicted oxidoreductase
MENKKIILGTAQFLNQYGIANTNQKKISKNIFYKILNLSLNNGIRTLDTANSYNNEKDIGNFIKANRIEKKIKIITKIPSLKTTKKKDITKILEKSLKNLNIKKFHTIFFHDQNDIDFILENNFFFQKIKKEFGNPNFGLSLYDKKVLKKIDKMNLINCVQVPLNFLNDDFLKLKYKKNFKIFARSIFLQGFLINEKINYINLDNKTISAHKKYFIYLKKNKIDPLKFCLSFINSVKKLDYYIFGTNYASQLKQILQAKRSLNIDLIKLNEIRSLFKNSTLDPRKW